MGVMDGDRPVRGKGTGKSSAPQEPTRTIEYKPTRDASPESILTPEERAAIRENARLRVLDEIKDRASKQLLDQYMQEERQALVPEEELHELYIDAAPHTPYIMLDGKQYMHGHVYAVRKAVWQVLTEQINRGWAHDDQTQVTDARGRRRYRPPAGIGYDNFVSRVGPWGDNRNLVVNSGQLQGSSAAAVMGYRGAVEGLSG